MRCHPAVARRPARLFATPAGLARVTLALVAAAFVVAVSTGVAVQ
jgi:hypothetical protein